MPTIKYHLPDGSTTALAVDESTSIMQAAVQHGVPGIVGECGGQAMCATCHVYVRNDYLARLPEMCEDEAEMLEVTAAERDENRSRLGCQIRVGGHLHGVEVDVPETQV